MSVRSDVRTYLLAQSGISDLVGTRIYPGVLPQGATRPAVEMHVISRTHVQHLQGIQAAGTVRFQFDVSAETQLAADAVAEAIVAAFRSLAASPATIGAATYVGDLEIQGPRDTSEPPDDGSDAWTYGASLDVILYVG